MSGRVPHRPHYRSMRQRVQSYKGSQKQFLYTRWSYRQPHPVFRKRFPGYSLSLLPLPHYPIVHGFPF